MDIDTHSKVTKWCFPVNVVLIDKLNILNYHVTNTLVLWNKYQIIIYSDYETDKNPTIIVPEFILSKILIVNNCLICLDESGNLHSDVLKLEKSIQNQSISFKPKDQAIIAFIDIDDYVLCCQQREENIFLVQYQVKTNLKKRNQYILNLKTKISRQTCYEISKETILKYKMLSDKEIIFMQKFFHINNSKKKEESLLLVFSFDHRYIYGCIYNKRGMNENLDLHLLYSCPSEAVDIQIYSYENISNIIIGLKSGTFIMLNLNDDALKPKIVHVNTSIYRFISHKNHIIYSNGCTMWKVENISSEVINIRQFFVTQVKDFVINGDKIMCMSFTNIVYVFLFDNEDSYFNDTKQFYPLNKVLNLAETLFNNILLEVKNNEDVLEKLKREENLITAMALANKQDLMEKAILYKVFVYEQYADVLREWSDVILMNDLKDYFETNTFSVLIQLTLAPEYTQKMKEILSYLIDELRLHLAIVDVCTKTASVHFDEIKNQANLLLAYQKNAYELNLKIKLVSSTKEAFDENGTIWTVISRKKVTLASEHFIDSTKSEFNPRHLQKFENIDLETINTNEKYFGASYSFERKNEIGTHKEFTFYIKLPENFESTFSNISSYENMFNKFKAEYLVKKLGSNDFLKNHKCIIFHVGEVEIKISVVDEYLKKHLQISSTNLIILFHFRCYFSKLLYDKSNTQNFLLPHVEYTVLENLKRKLQTSLSSPIDEDTIMNIAEKFHKNIIGSLPL